MATENIKKNLYIMAGIVLYFLCLLLKDLECQGWTVQGGWIFTNCGGL